MGGKIIAVVGMCGSGKSEAVKFFVEQGYKRVYFGDSVFEHMKKERLEINEKNERKTREQLRKDYGMAAMAILNLDRIKDFAEKGNVVVESLYSWEEYKVLEEVFGSRVKLLTIYTTKEIRYKRLSIRKERPLTFEESKTRDLREIEISNKGGPIAYSDYLVVNDGTMDDMMKKLGGLI